MSKRTNKRTNRNKKTYKKKTKRKYKTKRGNKKRKNMKGGTLNLNFFLETDDKYYYDDTDNNINIEIDKSSPLNIDIFTAQSDKKKNRAKKGMARKILCELLKHISIDKSNDEKITLSISGHNIQGIISDDSKLKNMYENMGFKSVDGGEMNITIRRFIQECEYNEKKDSAHMSTHSKAHRQEEPNFILRQKLGLPPLPKYLPPPPS